MDTGTLIALCAGWLVVAVALAADLLGRRPRSVLGSNTRLGR